MEDTHEVDREAVKAVIDDRHEIRDNEAVRAVIEERHEIRNNNDIETYKLTPARQDKDCELRGDSNRRVNSDRVERKQCGQESMRRHKTRHENDSETGTSPRLDTWIASSVEVQTGANCDREKQRR